MLGSEHIMILAVVLGAMILFVTNKLRVDLVALCVLAVLLISRIIEPEQALYGFANVRREPARVRQRDRPRAAGTRK